MESSFLHPQFSSKNLIETRVHQVSDLCERVHQEFLGFETTSQKEMEKLKSENNELQRMGKQLHDMVYTLQLELTKQTEFKNSLLAILNQMLEALPEKVQNSIRESIERAKIIVLSLSPLLFFSSFLFFYFHPFFLLLTFTLLLLIPSSPCLFSPSFYSSCELSHHINKDLPNGANIDTEGLTTLTPLLRHSENYSKMTFEDRQLPLPLQSLLQSSLTSSSSSSSSSSSPSSSSSAFLSHESKRNGLHSSSEASTLTSFLKQSSPTSPSTSSSSSGSPNTPSSFPSRFVIKSQTR
jgi:hypothetical protein